MAVAVPCRGRWARPPTRVAAHVWQKCTDPAAPLHLVHRPLAATLRRCDGGRAVLAVPLRGDGRRVRIYG